MRDILFRGKRLDNGEWVCSGSTIHFTPEEGDLVFIAKKDDRCGCVQDENDNILSIEYGTLYKVNPETVGQFTGEIDGNGKMIFEGDIVRCKRIHCDGKEMVAQITYKDCCFCAKEKKSVNQPAMDLCSDFEVIGNIHDNPELLED